jgi:hypothetical protein
MVARFCYFNVGLELGSAIVIANGPMPGVTRTISQTLKSGAEISTLYSPGAMGILKSPDGGRRSPSGL